MNALSIELDNYLAIRRGFGFALRTDERILRRFIQFVSGAEAIHLRRDHFAQWQATFGNAGSYTWSRRLGIVRQFANWLHANDERHEVPPSDLIPRRQHRPRPYIYSPEEIYDIVITAGKLPSPNGIRRLTYQALFGLIAVTGLRISEALSLDRADVDLGAGIVNIRRGKLGKQRIVPISESTSLRLRAYAMERDRLIEGKPVAFFVADNGNRVSDCGARYNFAMVSQAIGLRSAQKFQKHGCGPRIHDLCHTFAVRTMLNWYRQGLDPAREMIKLTTYLGHESPSHTYWYIEAVPELLGLASQRAEASLETEARA
ncbi:tyrosine-type recombinase/integrase (plasmid) [Rhizobium lusitanum]|uniref:tyrosine-type recombinase/integrase n=1 Tax=Rhizobium lusitanum TaxID=293958 RepID=UPI00160CD924|nr:tyrosine-type recombinase/integrase [Rhizobium lusitanum]QND44689.1 tyrosine-type recombinase/integrase [Rhizobium lusitanum]